MVLDALPSKKMQEVKYIIDTAHAGCRKIFEDKKAALKSGDEEALLNVGEGKDVMSILRTYSRWCVVVLHGAQWCLQSRQMSWRRLKTGSQKKSSWPR